MTKDEAVDLVNDYKELVAEMGAMMSIASLAFSTNGKEIEAALGRKLFEDLAGVRLPIHILGYLKILHAATDSETVVEADDFFERNVVISDE